MTDWRDAVTTAPLWKYAIIVGGSFALFLGVGAWLTGSSPLGAVVGAVVAGLVFGAVMTGVVAGFRRRQEQAIGPRSRAELIALNRSARLGKPPEDPALDEAALHLISVRRTALSSGLNRLGPWILAALAALQLMRAIADPGFISIGGTVFFAALAVVSPFATRRQIAKLDRLETAIQARQPET
ncbi:hypothetical protein J4573_45850 [Actinomadura barringtoniae]|uniref:Uncharacterized protein n=1 Tax=Actinomadura barringtoniae TaxID=1427535 RepID=A0A939PKJ4_9ACTN|nr:hypothetical protein [Actinomadura barringtoniae]MBO2454481.1 hypothetical protein [Actinomadura barringtoniae]